MVLYRASYILRYFTPAMGAPFEARSDYEEDMTDFFIGLNWHNTKWL